MKRFTETDKWRDPWFRRLSSPAKQLWCYLLDQCDKIGLVEIDLTLASADCGQQITEAHIAELGDRIESCGGGKFFLPKFIHFQYGELSPTCPPHRPILSLVAVHGIKKDGLLYHYPNARVALPYKTRQEKTRQEEGGVGEGEAPPSGHPPEPPPAQPTPKPAPRQADCEAVLTFLNSSTGRNFRPTDSNLKFIRGRLEEPGVTLEGIKTMIVRQVQRWKGTDMDEYLRPETLFNKTKFDSYYAARELPISEDTRNGHGQRPDRGHGTLNEGTSAQYRGLG